MPKFRPKLRKKSHLIIGTIGLTFLIGFMIAFPPQGILLMIAFFSLFLTTLFYLLRYALNQSRTSLFLSTGITLLFILRAYNLRHWLYPLLIFALVLTLEVYMRKNYDG